MIASIACVLFGLASVLASQQHSHRSADQNQRRLNTLQPSLQNRFAELDHRHSTAVQVGCNAPMLSNQMEWILQVVPTCVPATTSTWTCADRRCTNGEYAITFQDFVSNEKSNGKGCQVQLVVCTSTVPVLLLLRTFYPQASPNKRVVSQWQGVKGCENGNTNPQATHGEYSVMAPWLDSAKAAGWDIELLEEPHLCCQGVVHMHEISLTWKFLFQYGVPFYTKKKWLGSRSCHQGRHIQKRLLRCPSSSTKTETESTWPRQTKGNCLLLTQPSV